MNIVLTVVIRVSRSSFQSQQFIGAELKEVNYEKMSCLVERNRNWRGFDVRLRSLNGIRTKQKLGCFGQDQHMDSQHRS